MAATKQARKRPPSRNRKAASGSQNGSRKRGSPKREKVLDAVKRDLKVIAKRDPNLAESAIAVSALALAREVDDRENPATSRATFARALLDTLARLRELAPADEEGDRLDELSARRATRKRTAAAKG